MKIWFLVILALSCSVLSHLVIASENDKKPEIVDSEGYALEIIQDPNTEIMVVQAGEVTSMNVKIKNTGQRTVHVEKVFLKGCGCSGENAVPLVLQPGQKGRIVHQLDTKGSQSGLRKLKFVVQTNDRNIILVDGEAYYVVKRDIAISPTTIDLGKVNPGEIFDKIIQVIVSASDIPKRVIASSETKGLTLDVEKIKEKKNVKSADGTCPKIYLVRVRGTTPVATGKFRHQIRLILHDYQNSDRTFHIPIKGNVFTGVECLPKQLFLGYIRSEIKLDKTIEFIYPKGKDVEVELINGPKWLNISYDVKQKSEEKMELTLAMEVGHPDKMAGTEILEIIGKLNNKTFVINLPCIFVYANK